MTRHFATEVTQHCSSSTIVARFEERVRATPDRTACFEYSDARGWTPRSWHEYAVDVERLRGHLVAKRVGCGTRVGICAPNSYTWETLQMAAWKCGASVAGFDLHYPTPLLSRLVAQSGVQVLFVQSAAFADALPLPTGVQVVALEGPVHAGVSTLTAWLQAGAEASASSLVRPEDEAMVIFSSGTTGDPKPTTYRHEQLVFAIDAILQKFSDLRDDSRLLCWLPLANLFQRMVNLCGIVRGATTYLVADPRTVMARLPEVDPQVFIGVPRFFEKFHQGVVGADNGRRGVRAWTIDHAVRLAQHRAHAGRQGRPLPLHVAISCRLADRWVLRRIRRAFGRSLGYCISGSAPMPIWLIEWFDAVGVPILEAYGASENIVPIAINTIGCRKIGTVGRPLLPSSVAIAADGEIVVSGPGVAAAGNTLHTGDVGAFDEDGFLRVTGRKNDLLKSPNGRWIAPAEVEARLSKVPTVEYAVVFFARGAPLTAVVAVSNSRSNAPPTLESLRQFGHELSCALSDLPDYMQVKGVVVIPAHSITVAGGELTTNLKLRRNQIAARFAAELDMLRRTPNETAGKPAGQMALLITVAGWRVEQ
ncbi:MAG TPA: AMP-binding protein [Ideonella sp.]|uniref:AMP-dependent synthetase/ligase n=1 Tax=Ideonella sp. TaxID=1929293 RepID=UPI002E37A30A|nr:AMP-binding protein [Ideonella sp.]HEX5682764.1 AMP-binding protein [Ideonella sp.]